MKNSITLSIIVGLAATSISCATTVGFGASPGSRSIVNSSSTGIAAGSLWWVGSFANENFALGTGSVASNWATISNNGGWVALGTETGVVGVGSGDGKTSTVGGEKIGGTLTDITGTAGALNAKVIYLVAFNTASLATATQIGIFKATSFGTTSAWTFPTDAGGVNDSVTLSTLPIANNGPTIVPVGTTPIGSTGVANQLGLVAPVPEPSTAFLSLIGLMVMGLRRRRN